jgi:CRISPR/Cas system-associated protein endoribonuclease Cas2
MKKYSIISNKKRSELIERVFKNGESVSKVSKQLRMKLPSAKSIIRTFKKSGKIFDKKKIISKKLNNKKNELS